MMPVDSREYRALVSTLVDEHADEIEADAVHIANTAVAGVDRSADPDNGLVRTHGTSEYTSATLYPLDVIAHSEQPQQRISQEYPQAVPKTEHLAMYAIRTLALDLRDALRESEPVAYCADCGAVFESVDTAEGHTDVWTCSELIDMRAGR